MTNDELIACARQEVASAQLELEVTEREFGATDPRVAEVLCRIGAITHRLLEGEYAAEFHDRALAIFDAMLGPDDLTRADVLCDYADTREWAVDEAKLFCKDNPVTLLARAIEIYERVLGPRDVRVARALLQYAEACERMFRGCEARTAVVRALESSDETRDMASAFGAPPPAGWKDRKASPIGGEMFEVARDARLEGRDAEARQMIESLPHRARIADDNVASITGLGRFTHEIWDFSFSRDGARLALATEDGVYVINTYDLEIERCIEAQGVYRVDLVAHGSKLLLRGEVACCVFSAEDGAFVGDRGFGFLGWTAIAPDDDLFAIGNDRTIRIARISEPGILREIVPGGEPDIPGEFYDGGATIIAWHHERGIQRWRVADGEPLTSPAAATWPYDVAPDGAIVTTENYTKIAIVKGEVIRHIATGFADGIHALAVSPDGDLVVAMAPSNRNEISVFRMADGEKLHTFVVDSEMSVIRFSPDGRLLALATRGGRGPFWLYGISS